MTEYNEWKIWNSGECPVEPGTMGQLVFRDQSPNSCKLFGSFDISNAIHFGDWANVFAYRTVKEPVVEVVDGFVGVHGLCRTYQARITITDGKVTAVELA